MKHLFSQEIQELQRVADSVGCCNYNLSFHLPLKYLKHSNVDETRWMLVTLYSIVNAVLDHSFDFELSKFSELEFGLDHWQMFGYLNEKEEWYELGLLEVCAEICAPLNFYGSDRLVILAETFERIVKQRKIELKECNQKMITLMLCCSHSHLQLPLELLQFIFLFLY